MGWQLLAVPNRICLVDIWDERPLNRYITEKLSNWLRSTIRKWKLCAQRWNETKTGEILMKVKELTYLICRPWDEVFSHIWHQNSFFRMQEDIDRKSFIADDITPWLLCPFMKPVSKRNFHPITGVVGHRHGKELHTSISFVRKIVLLSSMRFRWAGKPKWLTRWKRSEIQSRAYIFYLLLAYFHSSGKNTKCTYLELKEVLKRI